MFKEADEFYGSVTVGERGQLVIPSEIRRTFGIEAGDKLLIYGNDRMGFAFATLEMLSQEGKGLTDLLGRVSARRAKGKCAQRDAWRAERREHSPHRGVVELSQKNS